MNYIDNVNYRIKEYFNVLEPKYPRWLNDYINTKEMLHQQYISITCGTIYSDLYKSDFFFSTLDHSIAVALIIWHFTHDKKQTLAGLFHDIATPVFKHCIDFLNGDYMNQESTEDLTTLIISNSNEIMKLLRRDNINIDDVCDYHIYPIADNDTPRLSSDRLEYSLSNALFTYDLKDIDWVFKIYNDIEVGTNEDGIAELVFKTEDAALSFVDVTSKLSIIYREDKTRYSMQLLADIIKRLNNDNVISKSDLYTKKEEEIIDIIRKSNCSSIFSKWEHAREVISSKTKPEGVYYVHHASKIRYINPLVKNARIYNINKSAKEMIDNNLAYDMSNYIYLG
mgnify:CR=1 FL=1